MPVLSHGEAMYHMSMISCCATAADLLDGDCVSSSCWLPGGGGQGTLRESEGPGEVLPAPSQPPVPPREVHRFMSLQPHKLVRPPTSLCTDCAEHKHLTVAYLMQPLGMG